LTGAETISFTGFVEEGSGSKGKRNKERKRPAMGKYNAPGRGLDEKCPACLSKSDSQLKKSINSKL